MKLVVRLFVLVTGLAVLAVQPARGAAYIKFDGVDGESNYSPAGSDWCDMDTFTQALAKPGDTYSGRRAAGGAPFEVEVTKSLDKASPKIAEASVMSPTKVFPKVEIHLLAQIGGTQKVFLKIELKNVIVTSYSISGDADDRPTEEFSLNYEEIKVTYSEYDDAGSHVGNVDYIYDTIP